MELRREFMLTMGLLALLNLALAFGAIGLLTRMGPAIELILEDNVYSIGAAEEMLFELAVLSESSEEGPAEAARRERAFRALERAAQNVTEEGEAEIVASLEAQLPLALSGDTLGLSRVLDSLRELIAINRAAMARVDLEAKRLGTAGAWASVFAGVLSFLLTLLLAARLQRRFTIPIAGIHDVLQAALGGDSHRRCRTSHGPTELVEIAHAVNRLLDERAAVASRDLYDDE